MFSHCYSFVFESFVSTPHAPNDYINNVYFSYLQFKEEVLLSYRRKEKCSSFILQFDLLYYLQKHIEVYTLW